MSSHNRMSMTTTTSGGSSYGGGGYGGGYGGSGYGGISFGGGSSYGTNRVAFSRSSAGGGRKIGRAQSLILGTPRAISQSRSSSSRFSSAAPGLTFGSGKSFGLMGGLSSQQCVDLSAPLPVIDNRQQVIRVEESEQIKGLNDQFACFIGQVRSLEQRNKKLEIQLKLLKEQGDYTSNIDSMFQTYIENLKRQLDSLGQEKLKFEADLSQMQGLVEDFKGKYEDEINKRTEMENEFVLVKKDVDESYMNKVELEAKLESLTDEIHFLQSIFDEEIRELQAQIQNTAVSVQLAGGPALNIEQLLKDARVKYDALAKANRSQTEQWRSAKVEELNRSSGQYGDELGMIRDEIKSLNLRIRGLNNDIEALKNQRQVLEARIKVSEEQGEASLKDAKIKIADLEVAIANAQKQLAKQVQEYEALAQIKMALAIEITTYDRLLQGEEKRMTDGVQTLNIQQIQSQGNVSGFSNTSGLLESSLAGLGGGGSISMIGGGSSMIGGGGSMIGGGGSMIGGGGSMIGGGSSSSQKVIVKTIEQSSY